jgi:hypothetical protein
MSRKSGLKRRQIENIAQKVMPVLIYNLLQAGKLDRSRLSDRQYVWSVALGSDDEDIEKGRTIIDKRFIEYAEKAIAAQDLEVAVVLIATVIEHRLNRFYVQALEMSLSDSTISEILRNSIHAKLEWLMSLVSPRPIPEDRRCALQVRTIRSCRPCH